MPEIKNSEFLLPKTLATLESLIEKADFLHHYSFVDGSAIALHLRRRKSEDLDFFTWDSQGYQFSAINQILSSWDNKQVLNQSDTQTDLLLDQVKVTFFNSGWSFLKPMGRPEQFNLASLPVLSAMKVHTLFMRAKYRDYYDLYFLVQELGLEAVFENAQLILNGLTKKLFFTAMTYVDDIVDDDIAHLYPVENLSKYEIRAYFEN